MIWPNQLADYFDWVNFKWISETNIPIKSGSSFRSTAIQSKIVVPFIFLYISKYIVLVVGCKWPWANFNIIWNCYPDLNSIILILLKWVKVLWLLSFRHQANIPNWSFMHFIWIMQNGFLVGRHFWDRKTWCTIRTLNNNSLFNFKLLFIHFFVPFLLLVFCFYSSNKVVRLMPYDPTQNTVFKKTQR